MREKEFSVNLEGILLDLQSQDETVRAKAVHDLCPCHAGWDGFEQLIGVVLRLTHDRSPAVRAGALHVYHDAVRIQSLEDSAHRLEAVEEELCRKHAFRSGEEARFMVRRSGAVKRHRNGFVLR
jgi:hypothetical protein